MSRQRYFSKVYWHFTGSPEDTDWSLINKPADLRSQGKRPKRLSKATDILCKILESKTLLATCREKLFRDLVTDEFCCVCDIPIKDLTTHAPYYGKVAIGFSAEAVYRAGFNPVLYLSDDNIILGVASDPIGEADDLIGEADEPFYTLEPSENFAESASAVESLGYLFYGSTKAFFGENYHYLKFTTFDVNDDHSFYREREWRLLRDFRFAVEDVEAILAPKSQLKKIRDTLAKNGYPDSISLLSWEFLERA